MPCWTGQHTHHCRLDSSKRVHFWYPCSQLCGFCQKWPVWLTVREPSLYRAWLLLLWRVDNIRFWLLFGLSLWLLCCWHLFKLWYGCSVSTGSDYTVVEFQNYPHHTFIFLDRLQKAVLLLLCVHAQMLSCAPLFVTPWTVDSHVPLFMGFSRQKYWSGLPFPPPGDLPNPGVEPRASCKAGRFFTIWAIGEALLLLLQALKNRFYSQDIWQNFQTPCHL